MKMLVAAGAEGCGMHAITNSVDCKIHLFLGLMQISRVGQSG